jgi:membrane-anchored protein YejM (alkaline phosphatase superfamily)
MQWEKTSARSWRLGTNTRTKAIITKKNKLYIARVDVGRETQVHGSRSLKELKALCVVLNAFGE